MDADADGPAWHVRALRRRAAVVVLLHTPALGARDEAKRAEVLRDAELRCD
jgi:hypothetical protein